MGFFSKQLNRFIYLGFLTIIWTLHFFVLLLYVISPLLKKRNKRYDLALYPYTQIGSDGYTRRFTEYITFIKKDKIKFTIFDVYNDKKFRELDKKSKINSYVFFIKVYLKRIFQTVRIRNYKKAFIHRSLFPYYFYNQFPFLEKLAFQLCDHIVIDFWDAVWVGNKKLVDNTVKYAHKVSVVNDFLFDYFNKIHNNVFLFSIGINKSHYVIKKNYDLASPKCITMAYTGLPVHTKKMFDLLDDVFKKLSVEFRLRMILISAENYSHPNVEIIHHKFDLQTFFKLLTKADIGIYAVEDNVYSRGKLSMKTLDYASCGLPQICSPFGLSPYFRKNDEILLARNDEEWIDAFKKLYKSKELRQKLGVNSNKIVENFHEISKSYNDFKKLIRNL